MKRWIILSSIQHSRLTDRMCTFSYINNVLELNPISRHRKYYLSRVFWESQFLLFLRIWMIASTTACSSLHWTGGRESSLTRSGGCQNIPFKEQSASLRWVISTDGLKLYINSTSFKNLDTLDKSGYYATCLGNVVLVLDFVKVHNQYPFNMLPAGLNARFPFQLKFKRRVYKMLNMDEKQLKSINSRSNLKKFLDHVTSNNVEKVNKMCNKGLDPNFHCQDSGGKSLTANCSWGAKLNNNNFRDSPLSHRRDQIQAGPDGDDACQRRRHPRLQDQGRQHRHAPRRGHKQCGGGEDDAGARGLAQLSRQPEPDSPVPELRHGGLRPRHHRDPATWPRRDRGPGPAGLAGGAPGEHNCNCRQCFNHGSSL